MNPTTDAVADFLGAMEAAGVKPLEPIAAALGKGLVRFRCDGDGPGKRNGWAVLHLDGRPAGAFGNYKLGVTERWRAGSTERLPREERRELARQYRAARVAREAQVLELQKCSAASCWDRWNRASSVDPLHPYLVRKGVSGEGLRQLGSLLLVPMFDADAALWNLQTISPDGVKRFAKGARQSGLHLLIGKPGERLVVAEGYGTAAVIRRATGLPVVIAFSAANLTATALAIRSRFPAADIVIGADDDAHLVEHPTIQRNLGLDAAMAAAQAVGGRVAVPPRRAT
jgi:putative DNA primase/helicase